MSAQENLAFGIPYAPREERLASLKTCASRLLESETTVWVGGRGRTIEIARDVGAVVNLWSAGPDEIASVRADYSTEVTWGGTPGGNSGTTNPANVSEIADQLTEIGLAGATWAVCTWPAAGLSPEELSEAAGEVRKRLGVAQEPLAEKDSETSS